MAAAGLGGVAIDGGGFTLTAKTEEMAVCMSSAWLRTAAGAPGTGPVSR